MNILSKVNIFFDNLDDCYGVLFVVLLLVAIVYSMNNVEGMGCDDHGTNGSDTNGAKAVANGAKAVANGAKVNGAKVNGANGPSANGAKVNGANGATANVPTTTYSIGDALNNFASANGSFGPETPPSMENSKKLMMQMGLPSENLFSGMFEEQYAKFEPIINTETESRVKAFDPTYGGLQNNQMGKHVNAAINVSNNLKRNTGMGVDINNVFPLNVASVQAPTMANASGAKANGNGAKANGKKGDINLRMIYANWCGHSKRALPDFDKVISDYDGKTMNGYTVHVSKHDEKEEPEVVKKYKVRGFPSYVIETPNGVKDVNQRSYDGLEKVIKENTA